MSTHTHTQHAQTANSPPDQAACMPALAHATRQRRAASSPQAHAPACVEICPDHLPSLLRPAFSPLSVSLSHSHCHSHCHCHSHSHSHSLLSLSLSLSLLTKPRRRGQRHLISRCLVTMWRRLLKALSEARPRSGRRVAATRSASLVVAAFVAALVAAPPMPTLGPTPAVPPPPPYPRCCRPQVLIGLIPAMDAQEEEEEEEKQKQKDKQEKE